MSFQEYLKSKSCDTHCSWEVHLPELLVECGAYQYHMNPVQTIGHQYDADKYFMKPAPVVTDIVTLADRPIPISPALCFKNNLDGTNTPSAHSYNQFFVEKLEDNVLQQFQDKFPATKSPKLQKVVQLVSLEVISTEHFRYLYVIDE